MYSYRDAYSKAQANGEDTSELEKAYKQYESDKNLVNLMNLRNKVYQYRLIEIEDKATWMAVVSPYFGVDDLRWFFIQLKDFGEYVKRNLQLFDFTFDFNIYDYGLDYKMIRTFEASLFLSMLPLHIDNPHKVFGFLLNGINIIKELKEYV